MPKIVKVSNDCPIPVMEDLIDRMEEHGIEGIIVRDDEMEVFEYDELDNVTVHEDDIAEELGLNADEVDFLDSDSLNGGIS